MRPLKNSAAAADKETPMKHDEKYMRHALQLAMRAKGKTLPNPMVGCLIVKGGTIVGEGWHKRCGGAHAEIFALRQAQDRSMGATMYVTLEPCAHQGHTPPCVDQVIASGVKRIVIAAQDPNPLVRGRSIKKLKWAGVDVVVGVLQEEAVALNRAFNKYITQKMPFVTAKIAQSLDGKVATSDGGSKWITSLESRRYARKKRDEFDAILVGVNTVLKDDPQLNPATKRKPWTKIVVDSSLRIPLKARMFRDFSCVVATTAKASKRKIALLEQKNIQVVICPERAGRVDLRWLMEFLVRQEISNILIEGGSAVIGQALALKLVDRMMVYVALKIFGDETALDAVRGLRAHNVGKTVELNDVSVMAMGRDLYIEGKVKY